jgi:hypothetical protein
MMSAHKRLAARVFIAVIVGFTSQVLAQSVSNPGSVFPSQTSRVNLEGSEMKVLSTLGVFEDVTVAHLVRSLDFKINKELLTLRLIKTDGEIEEVVFVVRETGSNECGSVEYTATPLKRLPNSLSLTVVDPSEGCQSEKTKAVLQRSLGMTGMLDGAIEMEGAQANPF